MSRRVSRVSSGGGVLLLLLLLLLLRGAPAALDAEDVVSSVTTTEDTDEESDTAAFMIVVEHEGEWRCGGSLLSQRTVVTTARCALGPERSGRRERELWAFASALLAARAPPPLAAAARRVRRVALAAAAPRALGPALLELERPFDAAAGARPILLATARGECERAALCNAVRALPGRARPRAVRLRVVDVAPAPRARCAARVPHWPAPPGKLVCYAGDELCETDLGGGVVCDGKLCAVLGDTAASESTSGVASDAASGEESCEESGAANSAASGASSGVASGAAVRCSNTYAALAVAHWRRFLHCAHTLRLCGRGDCARLCTERRLIPAAADGAGGDNHTQVNEAPETSWPEQEPAVTRLNLEETMVSLEAPTPTPTPTLTPTRTHTHTRPRSDKRTRTPVQTPCTAANESTEATVSAPAGRSIVFEPNRADFKVIPSRTTLVPLKAGEYGDNAADYEGEEPPPPPPTRTSAAPPTAPAPPAPAARGPANTTRAPPALERRVSPAARSAATSCFITSFITFYSVLLLVV